MQQQILILNETVILHWIAYWQLLVTAFTDTQLLCCATLM